MSKIPVARLASGLAAMRPGSRQTEIFLSDGELFYDCRLVRSLVIALARHQAIDFVALRRRCRKILHARNYLPLPLAANLLLVPLPLSGKGGGLGYVNLPRLQDVAEEDGLPLLTLAGGSGLKCYVSRQTLHKRLLAARLAGGELFRPDG